MFRELLRVEHGIAQRLRQVDPRKLFRRELHQGRAERLQVVHLPLSAGLADKIVFFHCFSLLCAHSQCKAVARSTRRGTEDTEKERIVERMTAISNRSGLVPFFMFFVSSVALRVLRAASL